jgi:hypothetical protein
MAVNRAQRIDDLVAQLQPPATDPTTLASLIQTCAIAFTSASAIATSQAGPIVTSILAPPIMRAESLLKQSYNLETACRAKVDWDMLWQRTPYLLTNSLQLWPVRKFSAISDIFKTVQKYKDWSSITARYLKIKASAECEKFITKRKLESIGIKDTDGIWKARHRLFATANAHPTLNISADPFLIEARSPLAWSIALFKHNKVAPAQFLDRPSTASHKPWQDCHRLSLKYGVILGHQLIFKRIEASCMACIKRKAKPCRVAGGPLHISQLTEARNGADSTFKYIMMDLSAPLKIKKPNEPDELLYTLVSVCMVSKLIQVVSIDSKTKDSFLLALNVLFGEVGLPTKLFVDEEKGLTALTKDMIIEANGLLMQQHGIAVEIVTPAFSTRTGGTPDGIF